MALYPNYSLFVDVENGVASKSFNDVQQVVNPAFYHNDICVLHVYFVKPNNNSAAPYEEVVLSGLGTINVAIGTASAVATSFSGLTSLSAATATVTTVVPQSLGVNQIDRITIDPAPKAGTFSLIYNGVNLLPILSVNATADEVKAALDSAPSLTDHVTVTKTGAYTWDIVYDTNYVSPVYTLSALSSGIVSFTGFEAILDMSDTGVATLLDGAASAEATLEVSSSQGFMGYTQTAMQIPCTVYEDIF